MASTVRRRYDRHKEKGCVGYDDNGGAIDGISSGLGAMTLAVTSGTTAAAVVDVLVSGTVFYIGRRIYTLGEISAELESRKFPNGVSLRVNRNTKEEGKTSTEESKVVVGANAEPLDGGTSKRRRRPPPVSYRYVVIPSHLDAPLPAVKRIRGAKANMDVVHLEEFLRVLDSGGLICNPDTRIQRGRKTAGVGKQQMAAASAARRAKIPHLLSATERTSSSHVAVAAVAADKLAEAATTTETTKAVVRRKSNRIAAAGDKR